VDPRGWLFLVACDATPTPAPPAAAPVEPVGGPIREPRIYGQTQARPLGVPDVSECRGVRSGEVVVSFAIAPSGAVVGAKVTSSTTGEPAVEACVLAAYRATRFEPQAGTVARTQTVRFSGPS
jgi:TonB family protein